MIKSYILLASRIRGELTELETVLARAERAIVATEKRPQDLEFYIDSATLNLHDLYAGLEHIFRQIAATVDDNVPSTQEWHRDLLQQMGIEMPDLCPPVLSSDVISALDEYLRFRHVVRNAYTFSLKQEQIQRLVKQIRPIFMQVQTELLTFAQFLDQVGQE